MLKIKPAQKKNQYIPCCVRSDQLYTMLLYDVDNKTAQQEENSVYSSSSITLLIEHDVAACNLVPPR